LYKVGETWKVLITTRLTGGINSFNNAKITVSRGEN